MGQCAFLHSSFGGAMHWEFLHILFTLQPLSPNPPFLYAHVIRAVSKNLTWPSLV